MNTFTSNSFLRMAAIVAALALLVVIVLRAGSSDEAGGGKASGGGGGPGGGRGGQPPASVFVEAVAPYRFAERLEAIGTLEPKEQADLTLSAADRVTAVYFEDGQRVRKGQTLISLAQREQAALVASAAADEAQAARELERLTRLAAEGAVSQAELDGARRDASAATAALQAVQSRQRDRVLVAPFDGVVGFRNVSVGSFVRPGDVVTTLIDDREMRLEFSVPSTFLSALAPGLSIEATSRDLPGARFQGKVTSIDNAIDPVTRSVRVRATLPNADGTLKTGMFVAVTLLANPRDALAVREVALQPVGPENFVWLASKEGDQMLARRTKVEVGLRQDGQVEVISGVARGQSIITDGVLRVREGAPVIIEQKSVMDPSLAAAPKGGAPIGASGE